MALGKPAGCVGGDVLHQLQCFRTAHLDLAHMADIEDSHGENCARVRHEELDAQHEVADASGDCRGVSVGCTFTLEDHPREDQNREYLIRSVSYEVTNNEFETTAGAGGVNFRVSLTAMDAHTPFRPPRITPKAKVEGPQTAIVTGQAGEEVHVDEHGRVKVQFHWDRYGEMDQNSSCWIRVSQGWAGRSWGAMFLPRIGQEVVVSFLEGDPDKPLITGSVYNGYAHPPYALPDNKTKSTLKSNSSKGGDGFNEIRFEDKKGGEQIFIHSQRRMDVRVRGTLYETVYGNREIRVGWEKDGESGGDLNILVKQDAQQHVKGRAYGADRKGPAGL